MATEIHEFSGTIEDVEVPDKGPIRFALGHDNGSYHNKKKFQVWATDYKTKEPNPAAETIKRHEGELVTLSYYTKEVQGSKGKFPQNTVTDVTSVGGNGTTDPTRAAEKPQEPSESNTRSDTPPGEFAYLYGLLDDIRVAVDRLQGLVGGSGAGNGEVAAPPNPNWAPFFGVMGDQGFSEQALNDEAQRQFQTSSYRHLTNDQLAAIAESKGVVWSA